MVAVGGGWLCGVKLSVANEVNCRDLFSGLGLTFIVVEGIFVELKKNNDTYTSF